MNFSTGFKIKEIPKLLSKYCKKEFRFLKKDSKYLIRNTKKIEFTFFPKSQKPVSSESREKVSSKLDIIFNFSPLGKCQQAKSFLSFLEPPKKYHARASNQPPTRFTLNPFSFKISIIRWR